MCVQDLSHAINSLWHILQKDLNHVYKVTRVIFGLQLIIIAQQIIKQALYKHVQKQIIYAYTQV